MEKKKYAIVGVGGRSRMYYSAITTRHPETSELVAICDTNKTRMELTNELLVNVCKSTPVPMYAAEDFEKDKKEGNYNPYLYGGTHTFGEAEREAARLGLRAELYALEKEILRLPHKDYPFMGNIVKNILYYGLPAHVRFLDGGQNKGAKA
jgi:hypothetical protein